LTDIFALQEKIAKEITKALRLRLTSQDEKRLAKSDLRGTLRRQTD
jgi:hypothetical protein